MNRTVVGVLRGGTSSEYPLSLKSGAAVISALPEDRYDVRDILIDKEGYWHHRGQPATPLRALAQVDVVYNALHGGVGEDGSVQRILGHAGMPYTGSLPHASGVALNKILMRRMLAEKGIRMPRGVALSLQKGASTGEMARYIFTVMGPPYIVKPAKEGAGMGVRYVATLNDLPDAIGDVLDAFGTALVEEYIRGREASVGIVENFRNQEYYAMPPAEVVYDGPHLTPDHHASGGWKVFAPGTFTYNQKETLADIARVVHKALDLAHFSRSDFIVTKHGIYFLEANSLPGLYPGATFPTMLEAVGSSVRDFVEHSLHLARNR